MDLRVIFVSTVLSFISLISVITSFYLNLNSQSMNYAISFLSCGMAFCLILRVMYDSACIATHHFHRSRHRLFMVMCVAMGCGTFMIDYQMMVRFSNDDSDVLIYLLIGTLTAHINHSHNYLSTFIRRRQNL